MKAYKHVNIALFYIDIDIQISKNQGNKSNKHALLGYDAESDGVQYSLGSHKMNFHT